MYWLLVIVRKKKDFQNSLRFWQTLQNVKIGVNSFTQSFPRTLYQIIKQHHHSGGRGKETTVRKRALFFIFYPLFLTKLRCNESLENKTIKNVFQANKALTRLTDQTVFPLRLQRKYVIPGQADFSKSPMTTSVSSAKFDLMLKKMMMIHRRASWSERGRNSTNTEGICQKVMWLKIQSSTISFSDVNFAENGDLLGILFYC